MGCGGQRGTSGGSCADAAAASSSSSTTAAQSVGLVRYKIAARTPNGIACKMFGAKFRPRLPTFTRHRASSTVASSYETSSCRRETVAAPVASGAAARRFPRDEPTGVDERRHERQCVTHCVLTGTVPVRQVLTGTDPFVSGAAQAIHSASCRSQQRIWRWLAPRCLRYGTPVVAYRHEISRHGTALGYVMGFL